MPKTTLINLQSHDNQARKRGEVVLYFPHRKCMCGAAQKTVEEARDAGKLSHDSLRSDLTCEICKGHGYYWDDPIMIKTLVNDVTTSSAKELLAAGLATPGDMTMNPAPIGMRNLQVNDFDKVIFPHRGGQPYQGDVVVRGQFTGDRDYDLLAYPVATIDSVAWRNSSGALVECRPGIDYAFSKMIDRINWLSGDRAPQRGTAVSVNYRCYYEWIAFVSPFVRIEGNTNLGPRILLKKKHIVGMA